MDELLDSILGAVVELVTARAKDFDAVVRHRIVGCRDHHTEIRIVCAGQVGHGGCRQHAYPQCVDALAGHACDHCGFEHLTAGPRVTSDRRDPPADLTGPEEPTGRCRPQSHRQFSGQVLVRDSAHPVGAEKSSHDDNLSHILVRERSDTPGRFVGL